ncbi:MAG: SWIM zinc finger domain-containing protein [Thermoplasmata archaeon]|nr:SWIM zinc finger domain-containing protein [Candidatus Sysuiplasma acidicola]MBX8647035.1 SWIM zinc finger domain-containing protein [Candidatus Sysuiplasma acidicola]
MKLPELTRIKADRLLSKFPDAVKYVGEGEFSVSSESGHGRYRVLDKIDSWTCECRYFQEEEETCKHIAAVMLNLDRQIGVTAEIVDKLAKVSYPQNWEAYDLAQMAELRLFDPLLLGLVESIEDPQPARSTGRPRTEFSTDLFCAVRKVASMYSCRRSYGFLETAHEKKYLDSTPNYSISSRLLIREDVTPILKELVSLSAFPLGCR